MGSISRLLDDGSNNRYGSSGCGIVVKAGDREKWITISKVAVPLKACTAMATEITGCCVWTDFLDLRQSFSKTMERIFYQM